MTETKMKIFNSFYWRGNMFEYLSSSNQSFGQHYFILTFSLGLLSVKSWIILNNKNQFFLCRSQFNLQKVGKSVKKDCNYELKQQRKITFNFHCCKFKGTISRLNEDKKTTRVPIHESWQVMGTMALAKMYQFCNQKETILNWHVFCSFISCIKTKIGLKPAIWCRVCGERPKTEWTSY